MVWKRIVAVLVFLFVVFLFISYIFMPFESLTFNFDKNNNFSLENSSSEMQFYQNMRFSEPNISYTIDEGCNLNKEKDMVWAFDIIENETLLSFYEDVEGEIEVYCEDRTRVENGLFIAGEGGPTKIIQTNNFYVISEGEILLIRSSSCERPNIAVHELLHVLGFNHSDNSNNIMYPISKCKQTIGEDIISKIDSLYSYPSLPDLMIRDASALLKGRFLDLNVSFSNEGLIDSENATLKISINDKEIRSFPIGGLEVGSGEKIDFTNIWISQIKIEEIKVSLVNSFEELTKKNNEIVLKISE